jgi:large subunit ribosomal protein L30e
MDVKRALRLAIDTGKVLIGGRETTRALKKKKDVQLIIVALNCQQDYLQEFNKYPGVPVYRYDGTNTELGSACGKPFPISSLAILDKGTSNILDLVKNP